MAKEARACKLTVVGFARIGLGALHRRALRTAQRTAQRSSVCCRTDKAQLLIQACLGPPSTRAAVCAGANPLLAACSLKDGHGKRT